MKYKQKKLGFTLLEMLVSIAIFSLLVLGGSIILVKGIRYNNIIWDQLESQSDIRRVLFDVANTIRKAEQSSNGAFAIESADDYELVFYANVDSDSSREKVRYFLENNSLKKGVTKIDDNFAYSGLEDVDVLANYVVNFSDGLSLFYYYDENFSGVEDPLSIPIDVTKIKLIKIDLKIEKNPDSSPVPLTVSTFAQIRNLKEN